MGLKVIDGLSIWGRDLTIDKLKRNLTFQDETISKGMSSIKLVGYVKIYYNFNHIAFNVN
jgi:hypothetical protein